jgi:penicillin-binding protein 2
VAIEPETGDILAFVSKPTFDPNLFVEGIDSKTWDELNNSPDKPLLNRPLRAPIRRARRTSRSWRWPR